MSQAVTEQRIELLDRIKKLDGVFTANPVIADVLLDIATIHPPTEPEPTPEQEDSKTGSSECLISGNFPYP